LRNGIASLSFLSPTKLYGSNANTTVLLALERHARSGFSIAVFIFMLAGRLMPYALMVGFSRRRG
jgi:hypothetical protein